MAIIGGGQGQASAMCALLGDYEGRKPTPPNARVGLPCFQVYVNGTKFFTVPQSCFNRLYINAIYFFLDLPSFFWQ